MAIKPPMCMCTHARVHTHTPAGAPSLTQIYSTQYPMAPYVVMVQKYHVLQQINKRHPLELYSDIKRLKDKFPWNGQAWRSCLLRQRSVV